MADLVSISIYTDNQRVKLTPDSEGKFLIPNYKKGRGQAPLHKVSACRLVTHPKIKFMDPVLTLSDGTKLRVYQGGDPSGLITMAISLCEKHDKKYKKKKPVISKKKKSITILDRGFEESYVDESDFDYPWNDLDLYDDPD